MFGYLVILTICSDDHFQYKTINWNLSFHFNILKSLKKILVTIQKWVATILLNELDLSSGLYKGKTYFIDVKKNPNTLPLISPGYSY